MGEKVKVGKKKAKKPVVLQHCRYCGAMTEGLYCKACVRDGWNEVNAMFGSTNGWDRKKVKGLGEGEDGGEKRRQKVRENGELVCGIWMQGGRRSGEMVTETSWRGRVVAGSRTAIGRNAE